MNLVFDPLTALSLVYVFVFAYGGVITGKVDDFEKLDPPPEVQTEPLKRYRSRRIALIYLVCIPFLLLNGAIVMCCMPIFLKIISTFHLNIVEFDLGVTLFCVIVLLSCVNVISAAVQTIRAFRI